MVFEFGTALALTAATGTRIVEVPFTWALTPYGSAWASALLWNEGPSGTTESKSRTLVGGFEVGFSHSAPAGFLGRLDPLPSTASVLLTARVVGAYSNPTLSGTLPLIGVSYETYVRVSASVDAVGSLPDQNFPGLGSGSYEASISAIKQLGAGNLDFAGSLNASSKYGADPLLLAGPITATASLNVSASLPNPTVMVRYLVAVPEATSTGLATAAGLVCFAGLRRWPVRTPAGKL